MLYQRRPLQHDVPDDLAAASARQFVDPLPTIQDVPSPAAGYAPTRLGWLTIWMSGSLAGFIVAAVSVRALSSSMNTFEMMTVRSAGGLVILVAMATLRADLRRSVRFHRMALQSVRNVVHFGSQLCWTLAITLLPFATVFALEFTIPAFVTVLAVLFLGERLSLSRAGALAVCLVGVAIILRPGFAAFQPAMLLMVLGSLLFATAAVITKKLIVTEATFSIMLWMNLMQLPMNLAGSDPSFIFRLEATMALPLLGIAVAGLAVHYCLTNAFRCGDASMVIPMDFLRVPLIAVIGWLFYGEHLDAFVFAGGALIVAGVLWNVRSEAQRPGEIPHGVTIQPAE